MAQLQMPLSVWLAATPDERDQYYLAAGFDPNVPVYDNGTDTQTVRFAQDVEPITLGPIQPTSPAASNGPGPGDDLRDWEVTPVSMAQGAFGPTMTELSTAAASSSVAGRALRIILGGGGGRLTAAIWNSLPSPVRAGLTQLGIGIGAMVAFNGDIPFITLPGQGGGADAAQEGVGGDLSRAVDIQIGTTNPLQSVQVVGTWMANGVTFYRLADGKLAVQNKKGRWKVWRPKKPIVLYSDGASNLKTMLRADKALNKQAKKIAAMLNRRAPRRKSAPVSHSTPVVLGNNARIVDV